MEVNPLPSWRPGSTRDALEAFLAAAEEVPVADRVAYFDTDGTLWCERPSYVQLDFFLDALRRHVTEDLSIGERAEFAALLSGDQAAVAGIGLERIALALAGLFEGMTPEEFAAAAREFMGDAAHPTLGRPTRSVTYQPMSELIAELRRRDFTVGIVTGGGTEFVRAISDDLYGVPAELVVGTLIGYDVSRDGEGPRSSGAPAACSASRTKEAPRSPTSRPSWAAGRSWPLATPGVTGRCWNGRRPPALPALRC
jgi:haloacid dehalogenase-like hydrolase